MFLELYREIFNMFADAVKELYTEMIIRGEGYFPKRVPAFTSTFSIYKNSRLAYVMLDTTSQFKSPSPKFKGIQKYHFPQNNKIDKRK